MAMLRDRLHDDDSQEILETISSSAQRGAEMVAQVLSFARGQEGKRVEIQPADLIADVVRIARDTLPKNIELLTAVRSGLPSILGDPTQCHQVLLNLCVNARDAMPNGGQLKLSVETEKIPVAREAIPGELPAGTYLVFRVEDTGAGMPAGMIEKIFDPFFTTKEAGKGTGLGLSTSQTIVRNHGGHIRVFSEPGAGSRFDVYLPVALMPASTSAASESTAPPRGNGETILVVDDEDAVRRVLRSTLERGGYQVLLATNGQEALTLYAEKGTSIAAVVIDMTMPVLGGMPTMRELVKLDSGVRIIAASGIHDNEVIAKSIGPQVRDFLAKPFTAAMLLKAVGRAVSATGTA
jgi:CheY-like chemotaxis protein